MNLDRKNIRYTYNQNYVALPSHKHGKHIKMYDILDKSKQYTLSKMIASQNARTEYVTFEGRKQPLNKVLNILKFRSRKTELIYQVIDNELRIYTPNGLNTYKIYQSNKLDKIKVDYKLKKKLYNQ